jgi:predicted nucleotidyltransferase
MPQTNPFYKLQQRWQQQVLFAQHQSQEVYQALLAANSLFVKYGVQQAIWFGSTQQERGNPNSDVDLLLIGLQIEKFWSCWRELEESLQRSVDLYTEQDDPVFVQKVKMRGKSVYSSESTASQSRSIGRTRETATSA